MVSKESSNARRLARHRRMRNKISGTAERPRLNVYRSSKHIYVQIIDDVKGVTLAGASTLDADVISQIADKTKTEAAEIVGRVAGERAKACGIEEVVFDRGGYIYHGRVEAVADGARKAGLTF